MKSNFNKLLAGAMLASVLFAGCSANTGKELMTIGTTTIKEGYVKDLDTYTYNSSAATQKILKEIYAKEYKDEWKEDLDKRVKESYDKMTKDEETKKATEAQLKSMGYESIEDYKEKDLTETAKQYVMIQHYIRDNLEDIYNNFKLSKVKLITTTSEEDGKKMIAEIKEGKPIEDTAKGYELEAQEVSLSLKDTTYPTELVEEVIANDTDLSKVPLPGSDGNYYVYKIISKGKDAEGMEEDLINAFVSDKDTLTTYTQDLLKKYNFELHDETLQTLLKLSNSMLIIPEETEVDSLAV